MTRLFLSQPDLDGAIDAATTRVDANPNNADAHQALAEIYLQQGKHDDALTEFLAALLINGASAESYAGIAQVYLRTARYTEAVDAARRALADKQPPAAAQYALAASLLRLGRTDEGQAALQRFQQMQAEQQMREQREWELKMLKQEAAIGLDGGDYDASIASLKKVVSYEPDSALASMNLGLVLRKTGRHQEAIEYFNRAAKQNAGPEVHRLLAETYQALGQSEASEAHRTVYQQMKEERLRSGRGPR
jgi:tetratricopeptide (TPR) repeat protein